MAYLATRFIHGLSADHGLGTIDKAQFIADLPCADLSTRMKSSEGTVCMAFMTWTKEMSVGVAVLDDDHMRLVELLNELHRVVMAGKTGVALENVIEQMVDYTRFHFAREEKLFTQAGFPGAEEHKHEHEMLIRRALSLQARFENGQSRELSLEAMDSLQRWLSGHILGSDREYIPYLHAKGIH